MRTFPNGVDGEKERQRTRSCNYNFFNSIQNTFVEIIMFWAPCWHSFDFRISVNELPFLIIVVAVVVVSLLKASTGSRGSEITAGAN